MFTHASEYIIWARKSLESAHYYNYDAMKACNNRKQMKDVWRLTAVAAWEKTCGKHPTQKPLALLIRSILASTQENAWVLDPFTGSSTTGIAANILKRKFLGIDLETSYLDLSIQRKQRLQDSDFQKCLRKYAADMAHSATA